MVYLMLVVGGIVAFCAFFAPFYFVYKKDKKLGRLTRKTQTKVHNDTITKEKIVGFIIFLVFVVFLMWVFGSDVLGPTPTLD